ncbi:MAG: DMSO reductase family type II enzyme heme b subunit [Pseudohongiellaceae bacterium]|jgi:DMSO reductase family type II enzyme heme b subunit
MNSTSARRLAVSSALGFMALLLAGGAACSSSAIQSSAPQQRTCGRMLFQRHCASCHGSTGLGDGPGAAVLAPKPRDFSTGTFRLVSTQNGVPTDDDLFQVITRGILGSSMPPHDHLSRQERLALVSYVRGLSRSRRADIAQVQAVQDGAPITRQDALLASYEQPETAVQLPPSTTASSPELLAQGRKIYVSSCASCHDLDGSGNLRQDMVDDKGLPVFARDFTAGILKGGSTPLDIHRRIRCGMPGSPMPAYDLPDGEAQALNAYVTSLMRPDAPSRLTQTHQTFTPQRVDAQLSNDPAASAWQSVASHWVAMAPLQWTEHRVSGVMVQLARDANSLAIRLSWEDSTPESSGNNISADTAAIRLSALEIPQFFCPGRTGETHEAWEWNAAAGEALTTEKVSPVKTGVQLQGRHHRGFYEVVFLRDLSEAPERVGMSAQGASLTFEVRNGVAGVPDRSQNITVWHRLEQTL